MPSLVLFVDEVNKAFVRAFSINIPQTVGPLTQGNTYDVAVRFMNSTNTVSNPFTDVNHDGDTIQIGVGVLNEAPNSGTFILADGGAPTVFTAPLAYNITAAALTTALNAVAAITSAGGVDVSSPANAGAGGPWNVTWRTAGARDLLVADTDLLAPLSGARIDRVKTGDVSTREVQSISLIQVPAAFQDTFTNFPAAAVVVSNIQTGSGTANAVQRISLNPLPYSGTFAVTCLGHTTTQISFGDDGTGLEAALEALASVGAGNVNVVQSGPCQWDVTFIAALGLQAITAMTGNATALVVPKGKLGELSMDVAGIDALVESGISNVTFQIDVTPAGGKPYTVVATGVDIVATLIDPGASVPTPTPSYSTTDEMNAAIAAAITAIIDTDPTLAADSDALVASQKAIKTYVAGLLFRWLIKVANYTAVSEDRIQTDTGGGAFTITLPAAPAIGDQVLIEDATGSWATNNLTIARNGLKINDGTTNYTASVAGNKLSCVYISVGFGWSIK